MYRRDSARLALISCIFALGLTACQAADATSPANNNAQVIANQSGPQPTALTPATLAPTPTQFQPELTDQAATQLPGVAAFGMRQTAGSFAIVPSHYEWAQSGQTSTGTVLFSIQISIENASASGAIAVDPAQFSLLDSTGQPVPQPEAGASEQALTTQTLNPGETAQGSLFYQVPESEQTETGWSLRLVFTASDGSTLSWSLAS